MAEKLLTKDQLLQAFAQAYEQIIELETQAAGRGVTHQGDRWGPRETIAHLAGWEIMANVRIPAIIAGMPPAEFADPTQETVMNNAINAAFITLMGEQPLAALCAMLRQAYQRTIELLSPLDNAFFQPGQYVYERTRAVIDHCDEHSEGLLPTQA